MSSNVDAQDRLPSVHIVIVTHNNEDTISQCLGSIVCDSANIAISIVDNASTDNTCELIDESGLAGIFHRNALNIGFGAAVNRACREALEVDYFLFVNPDVVLRSFTIDRLVDLAARRPRHGLYAARATRELGMAPPSALGFPTFWQALAFAMCLNRLWGARLFDPDAVVPPRAEDVREVPVLVASLLLVSAKIWRQLNGFDERFFIYGEDVDLSIRARKLGSRPIIDLGNIYFHEGSRSFSSREEHLICLLKGRIALYDKHLRGLQRLITPGLILIGVRVRSALERFLALSGSSWCSVWRRRDEWRHGWPLSPPPLP